MNLACVLWLAWLILSISEEWWLGTVLTFSPRLPFALPAVALSLAALRWHRWSLLPNALAASLGLFVLADFHLSTLATAEGAGLAEESTVTVLTCNVQNFQPDFAAVLAEISSVQPDIVALQEARSVPQLLEEYFQGWNVARSGEFWIGSRYPLEVHGECKGAAFGRLTALKVQVHHPRGSFLLTNLHLMTPRHGLSKIRPSSLLTGEAQRLLQKQTGLRHAEAAATRVFVSQDEATVPHLVVGDFNLPTSSSLYRFHWSDLTNAFDSAGSGCGYTSPCEEMRLWPSYVPWVRIDHILATPQWQVLECRTGTSNGSDHRLVYATLALP